MNRKRLIVIVITGLITVIVLIIAITLIYHHYNFLSADIDKENSFKGVYTINDDMGIAPLQVCFGSESTVYDGTIIKISQMYDCDINNKGILKQWIGDTRCIGHANITNYNHSLNIKCIGDISSKYAIYREFNDCSTTGDYYEASVIVDQCWTQNTSLSTKFVCHESIIASYLYQNEQCIGTPILKQNVVENGCNDTYTQIVFCSAAYHNEFAIYSPFIAGFTGLYLLL